MLELQSAQTSESGTQAVPMLDKPYAFEDEQDSESDRGDDDVEEARNARKWFKLRGVLCMTIGMNFTRLTSSSYHTE